MNKLVFGFFSFLCLLVFTGCGKDYDEEINGLTTTLKQVVSDLDAAKISLKSTNDGSAAAAAKTEVIGKAIDKLRTDLAALSAGGSLSAEQLGTLLGKLQGLQSGSSDINDAVTKLRRLVSGVVEGSGMTTSDIDKMIDYISKISELESQYAVLQFYFDDRLGILRSEIETELRKTMYAEAQGNLAEIEARILVESQRKTADIKKDLEKAIKEVRLAEEALLQRAAGMDNDLTTIRNKISLFESALASATLTPEQIRALIYNDALAVLSQKGITPESLDEVTGYFKELVTLQSLIKDLDNMITNIKVLSDPLSIPPGYYFLHNPVVPDSIGYADLIKYDISTNGKIIKGGYRFAPEDYEGSIVFYPGAPIPVQPEVGGVVIQVIPANARLDKSMLYMIDSEGNTAINNLVEIVDVIPYQPGPKITGKSPNGLYEVICKIRKGVDCYGDAFKRATTEHPDAVNYTFWDSVAKFNLTKKVSDSNTSADGIVRIFGVHKGFAFVLKETDPAFSKERRLLTGFDFIIFSYPNAIILDRPGGAYLSFEAQTVANLGYIPGSENRRPRGLCFRVTVNNITKDHTQIPEAYRDLAWITRAWLGPNNCQIKRVVDDFNSYTPFNISGHAPFEFALYGSHFDRTIGDIHNAYGYYLSLDPIKNTTTDLSKFKGIKRVYGIRETAVIECLDKKLKGTVTFRVMAVNYSGRLVNPFGRTFSLTYL